MPTEFIPDNNNPVVDIDSLYGKKITSMPAPERGVGIDTSDTLFQNIVTAGTASVIDISQIQSFSHISQNRDTVYALLDTMSEDATIAAILEIYAEDATETNDNGQIVWCESSDSEVAKFVTFLLDTMNVDKHIYKWVYSLCKYGDLYLRLFKNSEVEDALLDEADVKGKNRLVEALEKVPAELKEDINLKVYDKRDKFVHYLEMVPNPAEVFELTKFGKSYAYIQATISANQQKQSSMAGTSYYKYKFKKNDIDIYDPTMFVHACLEDNSSRTPEEVSIFRDDASFNSNSNGYSYTVRRGQSLLYNVFKIWRELTLLENSLLLNRITKSSIIRVIGVEVGDMPKEQIGPHLQGVKQLIEQKAAINTGNSLNEYTNPGPMENNIYVPTHAGIGAITTTQVGGDVDVRGISDIEYFKDKFWGATRIPKQYMNDTGDSTGFNGGTSLSLISSRYAKMVKRIQNTIIQALTDAINLMLLDKGLDSYVNKFSLRMQEPTTQEEIDRRDNTSSKVQIVSDIMNMLTDVESPATRLKILKELLSGIIADNEVTDLMQEEIDRLEDEVNNTPDVSADAEPDISVDGLDGDFFDSDAYSEEPILAASSLPAEETADEMILPTPDELGIDMSDNSIQ